jgi:hypothetical protein
VSLPEKAISASSSNRATKTGKLEKCDKNANRI